MTETNNYFYPTAGSLKAGDKIVLTDNLNITFAAGISLGGTALIHTVVPSGDVVILSIEVDSKFLATTVKADTVVEILPPF